MDFSRAEKFCGAEASFVILELRGTGVASVADKVANYWS